MINYNNHNITGISYNNHSIKYVYGCGGNLVWSGSTEPHDYSKDYLSFIAKEDSYFAFHYAFVPTNLYFSIDGGRGWVRLDNQTRQFTPLIRAGERIMWKGTLRPYDLEGQISGIGRFVSFNSNDEIMKGRFDIEGNVMSLMYSDDFSGQTSLAGNERAFRYLFSGNTRLEEARNFVLPATTLSDFCYNAMFAGCVSLSSAPELPAQTLTSSCYGRMFADCTILNSITCMATDISVGNCTTQWVNGVAENGTFKKDPNMTDWTIGENGIPSGWQII